MERAFAIRRLARRVTILLLLLAGCEGDWWGTKKILSPEPPPQPRSPATTDPLTAGMIGEKTLLSDASPEPLRGFGLVVGLNGKGSSDCPTSVREYIIEFLSKQIGPQGATERRPRLTPEQLIDSTDTAVVEVSGHVLAGALSGSRFDLRVEAIQGTSTESLSGGLLLANRVFREFVQ